MCMSKFINWLFRVFRIADEIDGLIMVERENFDGVPKKLYRIEV